MSVAVSRRRCEPLTRMRLTEEEEEIRAGTYGPVAQQALRHQIKVGDFFGAEDFVAVTQAHIMADTESLGEAGVRWLEGLAAFERAQVRIPTITDPRGTDFAAAHRLKQQTWMLDLERRAIAAFEALAARVGSFEWRGERHELEIERVFNEPFDLRSKRDEEVRQVLHVRLARGVAKNGGAGRS